MKGIELYANGGQTALIRKFLGAGLLLDFMQWELNMRWMITKEFKITSLWQPFVVPIYSEIKIGWCCTTLGWWPTKSWCSSGGGPICDPIQILLAMESEYGTENSSSYRYFVLYI